MRNYSLNQALAKSQLEIKRRQSKIQQELKDKIFEEHTPW